MKGKYFPGNSTYAILRKSSLGVEICLKKIRMLCQWDINDAFRNESAAAPMLVLQRFSYVNGKPENKINCLAVLGLVYIATT